MGKNNPPQTPPDPAVKPAPSFDEVRRFWQTPKVEQALVAADIESSIAHVRMLGETNIVPAELAQSVITGLEEIRSECAAGNSFLSPADADIHASLHRRLQSIVGENADILHVAKSRNDQIATDIRLWLRDSVIDILSKLSDLRQLFLQLAERDLEVIMPGYTHMQPAMPIRLSLWWLANESRIQRDFSRLNDCYRRLNASPLGACEIAGTTEPIDRDLTARILGFDRVIENSLDATSDRDYVVEFASFASTLRHSYISNEFQSCFYGRRKNTVSCACRELLCFAVRACRKKRNPRAS